MTVMTVDGWIWLVDVEKNTFKQWLVAVEYGCGCGPQTHRFLTLWISVSRAIRWCSYMAWGRVISIKYWKGSVSRPTIRHQKTDGFAGFGPCCPAAPRCDLFGQFRVFRQKRLVPVAICGYGPWGTSKQKNDVHVHADPLN